MAITTHCLVNDPVGNGELRANLAVPGGGAVNAPGGTKRGVVVLLHGLSLSPILPVPLVDTASDLWSTFSADLVSDGWVVVFPAELGDPYGGSTGQNAGILNDLTNDAGNGSRLLTNTLHWWDHVVLWCHTNYPGYPIVPFGISWGGWQALQVAINKAATLLAYGAHVPVTQLWTLNFLQEFNLAPKVSYTLASGMNGLTLPQGTITVNESISGASAAGSLVVATTTPTDFQIVTYTGKSGSNFTGCTGGFGTGTMATSGAVSQSTFTSGLDIGPTALSALAIPGYLGWETADDTVGFSNTQALYAGRGSAPVTQTTGTLAHVFLSAAVTAALAWFTATVDPLAPAH